MLLSADDIILMAKDFDTINKLLAILECFAGENSYVVNVSKTK